MSLPVALLRRPRRPHFAASFSAASTQALSIGTAPAAVQFGSGVSATIAAWVRLNSLANAQPIATSRPVGAQDYNIDVNAGRVRAALAAGSTATTTATLDTGNWHLVVVQYDATGSMLSVSIDNGTADVVSNSFGLLARGGQFMLGGRADSAALTLDGRLDSVGFWKRVLSGAELTLLYNGGKGRRYATLGGLSSGLSAWWDLEERTGARVDRVAGVSLAEVNGPIARAKGVG